MIYDSGVDRTNFDSSGLSTGYEESLLMTDIEGEILSLIKGQFEGIKDTDVSTLGADWQAEQLRQAESLKSRFVEAFGSRQGKIMEGLQKSISNGFSVGISTSKRELSAVGIDYPDKDYTLNDAKEGQTTILNAFNSVLQAEAQAVSFALGAFVTGVGMIAAATSGKVSQVYDNTVVPELERGLVGKVTANGAHLELSSYVEGVTRETSQQALLMGESTVANAAGQHLVRISSHQSCCPKCQPYQGQILIDDVFADGKPDGVHELLSTAIANGLFHWNCRHKKTIWIPGKSTEQQQHKQYDEKKVEKNYELEQAQRALEREIRKQKNIASTSLDPNTASKAQARQAELQARLNALIKEGRAKGYAVYRQPHKEAAGFEFDNKLPYGITNNPLDNGDHTQYNEQKVDIGGDDHPLPIPSNKVNSHEYTEALLSVFPKGQAGRTARKVATDILAHREGTLYEDIYFINIKTGEVGAATTDYDAPSRVEYNDHTIKVLSRNDGQKYISIHNHPQGSPPSLVDMNNLYQRRDKVVGAVILGFDGTIYYYENKSGLIAENDYADALSMYKSAKSKIAQEWMAWQQLQKKYKIKVVKLI